MLNHREIVLVGEAVEEISNITSVDIIEILDCLAGVVLDEEEVGQIKLYHSDETDV